MACLVNGLSSGPARWVGWGVCAGWWVHSAFTLSPTRSKASGRGRGVQLEQTPWRRPTENKTAVEWAVHLLQGNGVEKS